MRALLLILTLLSSVFIFAQDSDPAYADFKEIDNTEFKDSPSFYVVDLKMIASEPGMATASWDAHKSLTKFLIELHDPTTNELFHRKIYRDKSISIPASAKLTVSPIHLNLKGKPKSTTLSASTAKVNASQRKDFEKALKQLQSQNDYNNYDRSSSSSDFPWRWVLRGIGLLALLIGIISRFAGKQENDFKDYDRRNRKP